MGHWTPTGIEPTDYDDDDDAPPIQWVILFRVVDEGKLCINDLNKIISSHPISTTAE